MTAPVVFIHGLWLHATSWEPWQATFGEKGYEASAPGWPGEPDSVATAREAPNAVANRGIDQIVQHYRAHIATLAAKPVVIGHSFGGLIAMRLLTEGDAAAAVAIDPAPIRGVYVLPPSALRVSSVALRKPANRSRSVALSRAQFRYGFGNAVSEQESDELYERWAIPSPAKPLFEAAVANLVPSSPGAVDTSRPDRGPLLITAGGRDHTIPPTISRRIARLMDRPDADTELQIFPDRGHSLSIDAGWREVADAALSFLARRPI